jgi:DNA-binding MarR family transcriptional regulator
MSTFTLSNPYTAIVSAIWGIIMNVAQATANSLGKKHTRDVTYEYTTNDSGAANPLGLLHPECRHGGCSVNSEEQNYIDLTPELWAEWARAFKSKAELGVLVWIKIHDPKGNKQFEYKQIAESLEIHVSTVSKALRNLVAKGYLSSRYLASEANNVERQVRDRLQDKLGGLTEVATPSGRIDLLTKTEIIEVKALKDWKAALGQILVYSAFYPEHQKRIHLFGTAAELAKLADIQAACLGFDVLVTAEEVEG